jgi:uncharacterized protein (DUF2062 family)
MFRRHFQIAYRLQSATLREFVVHRLLHADDPPHRLALGAAIGMFVAITPTVGVQMFLVVFLAWLLRANKAAGLPMVWVTNPATAVPIYYPCYRIGRFLLQWPPIPAAWWSDLAYPPDAWGPALAFYWAKFLEIAFPLWLGCTLVGLVSGWITYRVIYRLVSTYRLQHWREIKPPLRRPAG